MEIVLTKRKVLIGLLAIVGLVGAALVALKLSGRTLSQAVGFDSGRGVAQAGVEAFYSVNYQDGPDVWAARLCSVSTQPACEYYQSTVAPFLWPDFDVSRTVVTVDAGEPTLIAEEPAGIPMQIWQVMVTLSAPWPQGDGQISFPAHVLVVREQDGWKFERFLLKEELAQYDGGEQ